MKLEDLQKLAVQLGQLPMSEDRTDLPALAEQLGLSGNLYQELEMSHPFAQVHRDTSHSNSMLQLHSHIFYEVLCCRNSCSAEYLVGSERYRLQKGDIIFIPPGVSHRPLLPENMDDPYVRDVLWISEDFVQGLHRMFSTSEIRRRNQGNLLRTAGTKWEYLGDILHSAVKEAEHRLPGWDIIVTGSAMSFMTHLKRAFQDEETVPAAAEEPNLLDQVMAYIEKNLPYKITLADTAQHFFVSESTISQTFRKKMGVSFYRCVTQRRLIAAKRLIPDAKSLEQVAEQTGFSDYSVFYRAFRQEYGISPRQYRTLQETARRSADIL